MKRCLIFALALLMVLSLFACGGKDEPAAEKPAEASAPEKPGSAEAETPEDPEPVAPEPTPEPTPDPLMKELAGLWKGKTVTVEGEESDISEVGFKVYAEFAKDSQEISVWTRWAGPKIEETAPYTIDGNIITFFSDMEVYRGLKVSFTYDRETDTLVMDTPLGVPVTLCRAPDEQLPTPAPTATPEPEPVELSAEAKAYVGTWNLTETVVSGNSLTAEQLGVSMTLVFNEDGTSSLSNEASTAKLYWTYVDGVIKLIENGKEWYELTDTDGKLRMLEQQSGVEFVFEKQN